MTFLIPETLEFLTSKTPVALATIIGHRGSTPRTSGSRMLVQKDGTISGTIGGGLVEARVIASCVDLLNKKAAPRTSLVEDFNLDQTAKADMDMICGGSLTVWIQAFIPPFSPDLENIYRAAARNETDGDGGLLVSRLSGRDPGEKCLMAIDGTVTGGLRPPREITAGDRRFSGPAPVRIVSGADTFIIEPLCPPSVLYIFGGGHVGMALAEIAGLTDFEVEIIDDRKAFANPRRFPGARAVHVVDDYSRAFERLSVGPNAYVAIMTRGHLHDQTVLEQALKTQAAYVGMIGSRKKRDRIYANLRKKGTSARDLDRVFSPIGTRIRAETPAEIAVSIAGELIRVRAGKDGA